MFNTISRFIQRKKNVVVEEPEPKKRRVIPSHAGGPMYTDQQIKEHYPKFEVLPYDPETKKPQKIAAAGKTPFSKYWVNEVSDLDHMALQSLLSSTVLGRLSATYVRLLTGKGLAPKITLLNEDSLTVEQRDAERKKYQPVLDALNAITRRIDQNNDISFFDTVAALIQQVIDFGKGAILFSNFDNFDSEPSKIMLIPSRDMGIIETDDYANFESVQLRYMNKQVSKDDLIYLFNPIHTSQASHNAGPYGIPFVKPAIDAARALRKIPKDLEILSTTAYAGNYLVAVRPQGSTLEDKRSEYQQIVNNLKPAGTSVLVENPEDIATHDVAWRPEFSGLVQSGQFLKKTIIESLGLPQALLDESVTNRSSMLGKIQASLKADIIPIREMFSRQIAAQFYQRHFERLFPQLIDKIKIDARFESLEIATWLDLIQGVLSLDARQQLKPEGFAELTGISHYANLVEADAEITPGAGQTKKLPTETMEQEE